MSSQYTQLVEKINRIVRDRGDVELMVLLDRIADKETEEEQAASLGSVVKILNQGKKPVNTPSQPSSAAAASLPNESSMSYSPSSPSSPSSPLLSQTGNDNDKTSTQDEVKKPVEVNKFDHAQQIEDTN